MLALVSIVIVGGCGEARVNTRPPAKSPAPIDAERVELELDELAARFEHAAGDQLSAGECEALLADFQALVDRSGSLPRPRFGLAVVAEACGELDRAELGYRGLAERDYAPALINLGALAWARGRLDDAIASFARAVELEPRSAITARNNLSAALFERYRLAHARVDFEAGERAAQQVLAIDSDNLRAYENLARLYYERGQAEEPSYRLLAELVVTQGIRVGERQGIASAELHNLRGLLWLAEGEPSRAIRSFAAATEIDPAHPDAHRNLALVALRFRGFEQAERSLSAILADPVAAADVEVWLALGVARRGLGDFDGAALAYEQAAAIAPDDPRPWFDLGVLAQDHRPWTRESQLEIDDLMREASGHFERSIEVARASSRWAATAAVASDRLVIAQDTLALMEGMAEAGAIGVEPSPSPPLPAEEIERRLELEAQAEAIAPINR